MLNLASDVKVEIVVSHRVKTPLLDQVMLLLNMPNLKIK